MNKRLRLERAIEARRRAVSDYGWALRRCKAPNVISDLVRQCQVTDVELTTAMKPFVRGGGAACSI